MTPYSMPPQRCNDLSPSHLSLFKAGVEEVSETQYTIGGSGPLYGLASGASDDWAYGALKVRQYESNK